MNNMLIIIGEIGILVKCSLSLIFHVILQIVFHNRLNGKTILNYLKSFYKIILKSKNSLEWKIKQWKRSIINLT